MKKITPEELEALKPYMIEAEKAVATELQYPNGIPEDVRKLVPRIEQMIVTRAKVLKKNAEKPQRAPRAPGKNNKVTKIFQALCRVFASARAKGIEDASLDQIITDAFDAKEAQADMAPKRSKKN